MTDEGGAYLERASECVGVYRGCAAGGKSGGGVCVCSVIYTNMKQKNGETKLTVTTYQGVNTAVPASDLERYYSVGHTAVSLVLAVNGMRIVP